MSFSPDYPERVYAGVLGKMIGVYLGRPIEGWTHERITRELGEVRGYLHERLGVPLIVTDDDLTGTFTFIRALEDYTFSPDLTPAQIGHTWLNYLIEGKTVLWWGGMGNSTEHTAYLRLKAGIEAPESGSAALNGVVVAEQIGAQIFIDGWGMLFPAEPDRAADFARRAAVVSHDGEAVYAAQVIAAMEALAFVEADIDRLLDTGLGLIPQDSVIAGMIAAIRGWHAAEPDWRAARRRLDAEFGYAQYGGNVHVVPNHGLIILALLYGQGDFHKSLSIVNTAGWDTDCNSGNLGCLLGIRNGLAGLEGGPDWRGPLADRLYLPTADGGRAITDAVTETHHIVNAARSLRDLPPLAPKDGARFHFEIPGSVQGFRAVVEGIEKDRRPDAQIQPVERGRAGEAAPENLSDHAGRAGLADTGAPPDAGIRIENVPGHSRTGLRSLAVHLPRGAAGNWARIETPTFHPSREEYDYFAAGSYPLPASPTIYPGQALRAGVSADGNNMGPVEVRLMIRHYNRADDLTKVTGAPSFVQPDEYTVLEWPAPDTGGYPIAWAGLRVGRPETGEGALYLDYLTWDGMPSFELRRPYDPDSPDLRDGRHPRMWKRAWVNGLDSGDGVFEWDHWPESFRVVQNAGRGLLMLGTRAWQDYRVCANVTPHMCRAGGLAVRVQGMGRYYALLLDGESARLIETFEGRDRVLAETPGGWEMGRQHRLGMQVRGNRLVGTVDDQVVLDAQDSAKRFTGGGIALLVEEGRIGCDWVEVGPALPSV